MNSLPCFKVCLNDIKPLCPFYHNKDMYHYYKYCNTIVELFFTKDHRTCQENHNLSVKSFRYRSPRCLVFLSQQIVEIFISFSLWTGWWELFYSIVCPWSVIIKSGCQTSLYTIRVLRSFACIPTEKTVNSIHAFNAWEKQSQKGM